MTAYMVQIFLGDASNFGPEYFSSYAVAATLFVITFMLTRARASHPRAVPGGLRMTLAPQSRRVPRARRAAGSLKDRGFIVRLHRAPRRSRSIVLAVLLDARSSRRGSHYLDLAFLENPPSRKAGEGRARPGDVGIDLDLRRLRAYRAAAGRRHRRSSSRSTSRKHRLLRRLHGFLQLNISNLAGVPSIVYGIIGLTAFVQMFGLFGNPNEPIFTIGQPRGLVLLPAPVRPRRARRRTHAHAGDPARS